MKTQVVGCTKITAVCFSMLILLMTITVNNSVAEIVAKSYDIKNLNEVILHGGGHLEVVQGNSETLQVEADEKVIDRVVVDQSGSKLTLSIKNIGKGFNFFHWIGNNNDQARYILQLKNLKYLGVYGASHATLGNWTGQDLEVQASGAAEITFSDLKLQDFLVELTGASNSRFQTLNSDSAKIKLSGAANMDAKADGLVKILKVNASGASNFRGKLLKATEAEADASGASNIDLNATKILKAEASGASNIHYLGQPKLQSNASGASHINAINN